MDAATQLLLTIHELLPLKASGLPKSGKDAEHFVSRYGAKLCAEAKRMGAVEQCGDEERLRTERAGEVCYNWFLQKL